MMHRSYRLSRLAAARHVLWTFGLRPILRQFGARALHRLAPSHEWHTGADGLTRARRPG